MNEKRSANIEEDNELYYSRNSINDYEDKSIKAALPQIFAAISAASYHIVAGKCLAFSAILIPQLFEEQNARNGTIPGIDVDRESASWIASGVTIVTIVSALFGGLLIDFIGRLNSIRLGSVPTLIGWILIATANNMAMLLVGRVLTGIPLPWGTGSGAAYITEISSPHLRGSLVSFNSFFISLGFLMMYILGSILNWRTIAWICVGSATVPIILLTFIPESPSWLMMKGHTKKSLKAIEWFNRYQNQSLSKIQFKLAQERALLSGQKHAKTTGIKSSFKHKAKLFLEPTCYKPMLIITGIFFFQQFTGIYMTLVYAVNFMQDIGANVNPYIASVYLGAGRFATAILNVWLFRYFKKRHMLFVCTIGMSITMAISGMFTKLIHEGKTTHTWVPIVMPVLYVVFSMIGLLSLPFIYGSELFPLEVRGVAQSVVLSISYVLFFTAVKSYFVLVDLLGGAVGLQYYFSGMSLFAFAYCYIFVPETHKKKLSEIEEYFRHNTTYLSGKKKQNRANETKDTSGEI